MNKREFHPYKDFIPKNAKMMIVGSFPIGKFSDPDRRHEIKKHEFDFFFGGERNLLWKLIGDVFDTTFESRIELIRFLKREGIAIGDVVKSCIRHEGGASDSDLLEIEWNRELLDIIKKHNINILLFTSKGVLRWFQRLFPNHGLTEILLISPSSQTGRALASRPEFKLWKEKNPDKKTYQFILNHYKSAFKRVKKLN